MLKILLLLMGAAALILSIVPSLQDPAQTYVSNTNAICLALLGLLNLVLAPVIPRHFGSRQPLQAAVCVLLVLAIVLQTLILLAPLPVLAGQPAILFSLLLVLIAVLLHLAINLRLNTSSRASQPVLAGDRETGTVKWFNTSKGFGFISRDTGDDIFVHFRAIRGEGHRVLVEGQRVEFSVMQRDKGLQAEDVIAAQNGRR
jgi:CspA family cold shock protein